MPVDNTALTQEEIDFLAQATLSRRIANRGDVTALDRVESGTLKYALGRAKNMGPPVQGGFRFYIKGNRGQRMQWWQGADILTFQNKQTLSDMVFDVGKGHYGYELIYDTIERNGIRIDYNKGIREGQSDRSVLERVVNIIEQTMDDVEYDQMNDLRKRFMLDNADQPKCFTGRDGLIGSANTTGSIGKRARTSKLFQHQLFTGVTADNVILNTFKMIQLANRFSGGTKIDYVSCGDAVYWMLVNLMTVSGAAGGGMTNSVAGKLDYARAQEYAFKKGEKYNITLPQDCFAIGDVLIVCDPVYALLKEEYPTANWDKRMDFWNFSHFGIIPVITEMTVPHPMPYNQRLMRTSIHGEWTVWCDMPRSQGVMFLS
jgi:hypothetical protein